LKNDKTTSDEELQLSAELFSLAQLKQHALVLAKRHQLIFSRARDFLLPRLAENEECLRKYNRDTTLVEKNRYITPAAEWLLDNFYLIEEQIYICRRHLPRQYSRQLPRLANGSCAGYPRVYDIALEFISHTDARIDAEQLSSFVASYQTVSSLNLGELWAVPIMLRLALVENLCRISKRLAWHRQHRNLADYWADRIIEKTIRDPSNLIVVVGEMANSQPKLSSAFVTELSRRLQGQNPSLHFVLSWIEQRLSEDYLTIEQLVQTEGQNQAADQVSIGNSITSLRQLGAIDWREFVETMSVVEQTLRTDPTGIYGKMDFATRDRYRHVIEQSAKHCSLSEKEVAEVAIRLTHEQHHKFGPNVRSSHVGFHLIDEGVNRFQREIGIRFSFGNVIKQLGGRFPLLWYFGLILICALFLAWKMLDFTFARVSLNSFWFVFCGMAFLFISTQVAIFVVNWISSLLIQPQLLPRLDYSKGIAGEHRTLVVIPTILTSVHSIEELLEALEMRYLANRDKHLHFVLATDFRDSQFESLPEDEILLLAIRNGIQSLIDKYRKERDDIFFLFHRPRRWNKKERLWIGYERKRGKLSDLNKFLKKGRSDAFQEIIGATAILHAVKYIITLDTDTQLPQDSARQLVATMAHPLNKPYVDEATRCVTAGYGILQPRIGANLPTSRVSWFARIFAGDTGIDPYTRASSDVYQDLFGQGSYIGKGIYDLNAFEESVGSRFPENSILSHDLLESCYARSGLISDIQLIEDFPARYIIDTNRRERWIRGDWQISPWLFPSVPTSDGKKAPNVLSSLSRWKIFDNLRRTLLNSILLLVILSGWFVFPSLSLFWTCFAVSVVLLPSVLSSITELFKPSEDFLALSRLRWFGDILCRHFGQGCIMIVFLPYEAWIETTAILRSIIRMRITHRLLLEWQTFNDAERQVSTNFLGHYQMMWFSPIFSLVTAVCLAVWCPESLSIASIFLALWVASPGVAWWISRPLISRPHKFSEQEITFLRKQARKTWRFFEMFVTAQENWLPPDNYQEQPAPIVASRTSPTNIGLYLLANLTANDFGFISTAQLIQRTNHSFDSLQKLERYRGHFYNWYDTRTLKPLSPKYVSTVDSGNLSGHLLTLAQGFLELQQSKIITHSVLHGLRDTLLLARESLKKRRSKNLKSETLHRLQQFEVELKISDGNLLFIWQLLTRSAAIATETVHEADSIKDEEVWWWTRALERQCQDHLADLLLLAPWIEIESPPEHGKNLDFESHRHLVELTAILERIPTLKQIAQLGDVAFPIIQSSTIQLLKSRATICTCAIGYQNFPVALQMQFKEPHAELIC
jgi:cyclic beta-1,2-glucan synthetase